MAILFSLLGFFAGALWGGFVGGLLAGFAGASFGLALGQRLELKAQGERLERLAQKLQALEQRTLQPDPLPAKETLPSPTLASEDPAPPAEAKPQTVRELVRGALLDESPAATETDEIWPELGPTPDAASVTRSRGITRLEEFVAAGFKWLRGFFTGGNSVVRVGLMVLLVGVVLLLKYAAEHALFPIEARMACAALVGLGLVAIGYRQRIARPGFSTTLQGGGVATMYLVVFFSMRVYDLLPVPLGFGLLAALALFSGVMAVAQNSLALIVIGIVGGFLAPVLASTGSGNHVALFSYYILLNLLIVGVAWFKSWRPLNLLGFFFTFGVGTAWGSLSYTPEHFASTEPFLIAFFLMYVAIVVIFAWRRPAELRGLVDGSLTFGTPLAVLGLQYEMVKDIPFGMAFTAAGMGVVYVAAASLLFRRAPQAMRNLVEAFLALGIGFGTVAIPYGFSNQSLTGATWAIEGLGLYWLGIRQKRLFSRVAGCALQFMAGVALLVSLVFHGNSGSQAFLLNTRFAAGSLLALAGLGVAYLSHLHREKLRKFEQLASLLIPWALMWWYGSAIAELESHVQTVFMAASLLALVACSSLAFELVGRRLAWVPGRLPGLLAVPTMLVLLFIAYDLDFYPLNRSASHGALIPVPEPGLSVNPMNHLGWLAWPMIIASAFFTTIRLSRDGTFIARPFHAVALGCVALFSALTLANFVRGVPGLGGSWTAAAPGFAWMLVLAVAWRLRTRTRDEPLRLFYRRFASGGLVVILAVWQLRTSALSSGNAEPLPHLPLLNPIDVTLGLAFLTCLFWSRETGRKLGALLGLMLFLWFNGMLARTIHQYTDASYTPDGLWTSVPMQVSVSVSWALIGLAASGWATRAKLRNIWFAGVGLLAVVVAKLFLVDLEHLGSVAKIGTFLVVGVLLLVVGYFSPLPPAQAEPVGSAEPAKAPKADVDPS